MKPFLSFFIVFLILFINAFCKQSSPIIVGYLTTSDHLSIEDEAAINWLEQSFLFKPVKGDIESFNRYEDLDVVWIHLPDSSMYREILNKSKYKNTLINIIEGGGKILFTDFAAYLPYDLGLESKKPILNVLKVEDNWLFDKKGFQSFRGHPLFKGLFGGTYVWDAVENQHLPTIGYFGKDYPQEGKVVAVEKSYITIHSDRRLVIDYDELPGKIISVGGFVYFAKKNHLDYNLKKFIENCLTYLSGRNEGEKKTYWLESEHQPKQFEITTHPIEIDKIRNLKTNDLPDMLLTRENSNNDYYDVEGRRALIMGKEKGGIDEFWVHPFRVLRDYKTGVVYEGKIIWLNNLPVKIEVRPESFIRLYNTPVGHLSEVILPSLNDAGGIIHYEMDSEKPVNLVIEFRSDLRWMWPYDENAIGDVWYAYDEALQAIHIKDSAGDLHGIIGSENNPTQFLFGQFKDIDFGPQGLVGKKTELNQVYAALEYELSPQISNLLNVAISGSNLGQDEAVQHYRKLLFRPQAIYDEAFSHYKNLLENSLTITSPDPEFNQLWKWAIFGTDRFWVNTPDLGTALVAGYSTTARGWNGRHKISGRPGYAWYFGRDSEWSGFAIDNYGDFRNVRQQLIFLQKYQNLVGKIFHEISTSGVVHYDAADATPLYIILAAHYLRTSGDVDFIRESWGHIQKAMSFLYSTDTDQDGLIENTNVGHGWVEGGRLWGAHTTLYLTALWAQTLKDAAYLAKLMDEQNLSQKYQNDYGKVVRILNNQFWNSEKDFCYYGKMKNGSFNSEPTVLPAVAMYFNLLEDIKVQNMLDVYASNSFSTDWGVRILSSNSPLFNPHGYHYGSVWPLFTGWTALAEYTYGNSVQGFSHIMNNILIKNHWALGFVEEVMNGELYQPSGVCPHQCWSETNIIHPAIYGMVGWQPNAPEFSAVLAPRFPIHWDSVSVANLKMGESVLAFQKVQKINETIYKFHLVSKNPIVLNFQPEIPAGMEIESVQIDGKYVTVRREIKRGILKYPISLKLIGEHQLKIKHHKGIGMIPKISWPNVEEKSIGYRIIRSELDNNLFEVVVEGISGSESDFEVKLFDQKVQRITGGNIVARSQDNVLKIRVGFPKSEKKFVRKKVALEVL